MSLVSYSKCWSAQNEHGDVSARGDESVVVDVIKILTDPKLSSSLQGGRQLGSIFIVATNMRFV